MSKHKWKEFAQIIDCPYRIKFSTNGWGDYRIDNKGLYSYENKRYCDENDRLITLFLIGEIIKYDYVD